MPKIRLLSRYAVILIACACTEAPTSAQTAPVVLDSGMSYVPTTTWRTARPMQAGFDSTRADAFVQRVRQGRYGKIDALVVVRFGHVVLDEYMGWSPTALHTLQSITKSVGSLLFGILQSRKPGAVTDINRRVLDIFSRYNSIASIDDNKQRLTIGDLLTMRTSMAFWEQPYSGSPLETLNNSRGDWIKYILDRPMTGASGNGWAYNSGAAILLGGIIREIAGEPVDAFAQRELFGPLQISNVSWYRSPYDSLPHMGGGLSLAPGDLARIGYLVLRKGRWGAKQVIPAQWIETSTRVHVRDSALFFSQFNPAYGEFWWLFPETRGGTGAGVIAASGSGGQWLFVIPSRDLVIAIAASNGNGLELLYDLLETLE